MANEILLKDGTAIVWADTTDYSSTVSGLTRTAQIDLTSIANNAARQGAKVDLTATRADRYAVFAALEFAVAPTADAIVPIYFSESVSGTAGNANPGGASGADGAYTGTAGDSIADSLKQCTGPFPVHCTTDATTVVQFERVGTLWHPQRYVSPILFNQSGQALHSDAVEMLIALLPLPAEIQ